MKKGEKGEGDVNSMRFIKNINKRLIILISMVCLLCMLCGCNVSDILSGPKYSINDCIKKQNKNYDEIYELTCTSEEGYALISGDWDLIEKLVNLKKIQLIGIEKEDDAQQIFSELTKLKKLETVEIVDSKIGKISKLGEIENLKTLSIIGNSGGGSWFTVQDLDLLGMDSRFDKIESLTLKHINIKDLPNLSKLPNLQKLSISGKTLERINPDTVRWENLRFLEISGTNVTTIDEIIVERLINLQVLDISYSCITDVNFILNIPSLHSFIYAGHSSKNVDMECIKAHPNYTNEWSHN